MTGRGDAVKEDTLRVKNVLQTIESRVGELQSPSGEERDPKEILEPIWRVLDDRSFWKPSDRSLALYASFDQFRSFWLPTSVERFYFVGDRFYLRPLIPVANDDGQFFILAVSASNVRLIEASRERATTLELGASFRAHLARALGHESHRAALGQHVRSTGHGSGGPSFSVHGVGSDDALIEDEPFLKVVDHAVRHTLPLPGPPLVVAGVDRVVAAYRAMSKYPRVHEAAIIGNPDQLDAVQLRDKAWPLVRHVFFEHRDEALRRYADELSSPLVTDDLRRLLPAACDGSIDTLFVSKTEFMWGRYDREEDHFVVHDQYMGGDEDVLERLATETILHGGSVYSIRRDEIPGGAVAAALLRYAS